MKNHREYNWGSIPPEVTTLEQAFAPIHQKASRLIIRVAEIIEETHPGIRDFFDTRSLAGSPIRLLFYHPSDSEQLGAAHYDKSSLTIQIAESHEGLRVAPNKASELQFVIRDGSKAVVFRDVVFEKTLAKILLSSQAGTTSSRLTDLTKDVLFRQKPQKYVHAGHSSSLLTVEDSSTLTNH